MLQDVHMHTHAPPRCVATAQRRVPSLTTPFAGPNPTPIVTPGRSAKSAWCSSVTWRETHTRTSMSSSARCCFRHWWPKWPTPRWLSARPRLKRSCPTCRARASPRRSCAACCERGLRHRIGGRDRWAARHGPRLVPPLPRPRPLHPPLACPFQPSPPSHLPCCGGLPRCPTCVQREAMATPVGASPLSWSALPCCGTRMFVE